jgi:hypothetical protein
VPFVCSSPLRRLSSPSRALALSYKSDHTLQSLANPRRSGTYLMNLPTTATVSVATLLVSSSQSSTVAEDRAGRVSCPISTRSWILGQRVSRLLGPSLRPSLTLPLLEMAEADSSYWCSALKLSRLERRLPWTSSPGSRSCPTSSRHGGRRRRRSARWSSM